MGDCGSLRSGAGCVQQQLLMDLLFSRAACKVQSLGAHMVLTSANSFCLRPDGTAWTWMAALG